MPGLHNHHSGFLLVVVLVFGSIFFLLCAVLLGTVLQQYAIQQDRTYAAQALGVAEAGVNYYKWFLAHNPDDVTNGTGAPGPYTYTVNDPEAGLVGTSTLEIHANRTCGEISSIDITSTGAVAAAPEITRTIRARYARPTVANYAYIINANVWAGPDRTIVGPYHTNGVVRMDGTNNSIVSSGQADWECDGSIPCDPGSIGDTLPAVYGDGPNSGLWVYPQPPISFSGITVDLAAMQNKAQADGVVLPPSGDQGYRIVFQDDGTFDVYVVDSTFSYYGYAEENGWERERHVIADDDFLDTYTLPDTCSAIFVEDKVWLEGEIAQPTTIAVADLDTTGVSPSIILNDNITYAAAGASFLAIAEQNVLVGLAVPDELTLEGVFIAQNGRFGRNHYCEHCWEWFWYYGLPWYLDEFVTRTTLTIRGTIVSNRSVGTQWVDGNGNFQSGFATRYNSYDRRLLQAPPPLLPRTSDTYELSRFRQD